MSNLAKDNATIFGTAGSNVAGFIFANCENLANVTAAGPITAIPNYSFYGCTSLEKVDFTSLPNLQTIGTSAFQNSAVQTVDLSNCKKLVEIKNDSFNGARVTSLNIKDCPKLQTIGAGAFLNYGNIKAEDGT